MNKYIFSSIISVEQKGNSIKFLTDNIFDIVKRKNLIIKMLFNYRGGPEV